MPLGGDPADELRVLVGAHAVADARDRQRVERGADALGARDLAGMRR